MNVNTTSTIENLTETQIVENWNKNHNPGEVVKIKDEKGQVHQTITSGKAFIGRGGKAKIVLKEPRGHYSLHKIINHTNQKIKEQAKEIHKPEQNNHMKGGYYKLKDHLLSELKDKEKVELSKISINVMFQNIHTSWGIMKPVEQFKIFIEKYGMKVLEDSDSKLVISKIQ